ncbi:hypothetical protein ACFQX6_40900 [Streptosporangium lutulentum]
MLISQGETIVALLTISASAQGIDQLMWMMNPGKLSGSHWRLQGRAGAASGSEPD